LVHAGVLAGLAGPIGMIRTHDIRDWAQRQDKCHDYFSHAQPILIDGFWQVHCDVKLRNGPKLELESRVADDPVYAFMEKYWMLQQLPWALLFYQLGGWSWVFWGVCVRVAVCVHGHWLIGYFAHNPTALSSRHWHVQGSGVQGYNVTLPSTLERVLPLLSFGESWHNNHHSFPGSAKLGLKPTEEDVGYQVLKVMEKAGLAWNIREPEDLPPRHELQSLPTSANPQNC